MAKAHNGPGFLCNMPPKYGGGAILMRYLPLEVEERLRKKYTSELGVLDVRGYNSARAMESIVEVSPDVAAAAALTGGEMSDRGMIPVDAAAPGRAEVWAALGSQRRELLEVAWAKKNSVENDDFDPFLEGLEDVI